MFVSYASDRVYTGDIETQDMYIWAYQPEIHTHSIYILYKYRKTAEKLSTDGRLKKYMNKSCRDDNKQNGPYILFLSNRVCIKEYEGMHRPFN